jgi:hypothetical protein
MAPPPFRTPASHVHIIATLTTIFVFLFEIRPRPGGQKAVNSMPKSVQKPRKFSKMQSKMPYFSMSVFLVVFHDKVMA